MGPQSYMRSVVNGEVAIRRIPVYNCVFHFENCYIPRTTNTKLFPTAFILGLELQ